METERTFTYNGFRVTATIKFDENGPHDAAIEDMESLLGDVVEFPPDTELIDYALWLADQEFHDLWNDYQASIGDRQYDALKEDGEEV